MSKMPSTGGAYSVSKAGVWMATKCLAQELARHGIRVNAIGPGFIETPMTAPLRGDAERSRWAMGLTPMGRYGTADEVASTALFLASDDVGLLHRRDPPPLRRRLRRLTPHPALSPRGRG